MYERWRKLASAIALTAALVVIPGCDDTQEPQFPTITGSWLGTSGEITMSLSLVEDENGSVVGSGTLSSTEVSFPFQTQGGHLFPDVSLDLIVTSENEQLTFAAVVAFDEDGLIPAMDGSLTGAGFASFPITLDRR